MTRVGEPSGQARAWAIVGVAIVHGAVILALLFCPGQRIPGRRDEPLSLFSVMPPAPPPVEPERNARTRRPPGASSPANATAMPMPVVAPRPLVVPPVPIIVAAPLAADDVAPAAGAASVSGPGTGAGGRGLGFGSGSSGSGNGGGARARLIRGAIVPRDYPDDARRARLSGSVTVRFTVGVDGRVSGCAVTVSSGVASLDETTCRLIEKRFRYAPARDGAGNVVPEERGWRQDWWFDGATAPPG